MLAKFTRHALVRRVDRVSAGVQHSSIDHACNDNRPVGARATAGRTRMRRPVLACHWRVVPATGALECFWQDESADGAPAAAPSPWRSRMRHARQTGWRALDHSWNSQRANTVAASAPRSWATIKASTLAGAMPAKVSERARAMVTAGLANDVDAVNQ
jgi:hypothetical protein